MELIDGQGRRINYLRLSVTDRCNHRCIYCMPENGVELFPHEVLPRLEELAELTGRFARLFGIRKVRLTGGEPLLRKNIEGLVEMLAAVPGLDDLAMTSNGALLSEKADALSNAGLERVNVSVDSLDPDRFRAITCGGELRSVLEGLSSAREAGLLPIKINVVLLPDFHEESGFLKWANREGFLVRFIELMPNFHGFDMRINGRAPTERELLDRLSHQHHIIEDRERTQNESGNHVHRYSVPEKGWLFEVIPGVSAPFCRNCNRLRLDCRGALRYCLYSRETLQMRPLLHASDDEFRASVEEFVARKTERMLDRIGSDMSAIGG